MLCTFQIRARAERSALPRDDTDAQRRLIIQPCPEGAQLFVAGRVDAVERLRPA